MYKQRQKKLILLVGGGTGGSVSPLLAIFDELSKDYDFFWIGSRKGPEKEMVNKEGLEFYPIFSGKLRRYFSWQNLIDPIFIIFGFVQSFYLLIKKRPVLVFSAGSFVAVPVGLAAWLLKIPQIIHQQDVKPGLANKILAPFAKKITVTFRSSLKDYGKKAVHTGNPTRKKFLSSGYAFTEKISKREAYHKLGLNPELLTVLILGGGTGAVWLNNLVEKTIADLANFCQVIHLTGKGKKTSIKEQKNYRAFEFLDLFGMLKVFSIANIVISRCGMGVLSELCAMRKPSILIPIPNSHQEDNAREFAVKNAAIVLKQGDFKTFEFVDQVDNLLHDNDLQNSLSKNIATIMPQNANQNVIYVLKKIISDKT